MISAMKGSFTMILSVTLLCLPASWTSAATSTVHILMNPHPLSQAYIDNNIRDGRTAAKCCMFNLNAANSTYCLLKTHCTNTQWPLAADTCFTLTPTAYTEDEKSIYQSCTYSTTDGYCTPQTDACTLS